VALKGQGEEDRKKSWFGGTKRGVCSIILVYLSLYVTLNSKETILGCPDLFTPVYQP
jgi:hypothetical protein